MPTKTLRELVEEIEAFPDENKKLQILTKIICDAIPEMFEGALFGPTAIEITYSNNEIRKIYAWPFAENIARKLLGYEIEKARGDSWSDAQKRAGYIK